MCVSRTARPVALSARLSRSCGSHQIRLTVSLWIPRAKVSVPFEYKLWSIGALSKFEMLAVPNASLESAQPWSGRNTRYRARWIGTGLKMPNAYAPQRCFFWFLIPIICPSWGTVDSILRFFASVRI